MRRLRLALDNVKLNIKQSLFTGVLMKSRKMKIGELNFNTKKSAIEFYRSILNKYDANTSVDDEDFSYLIDLLNYNSDNNEIAVNEENKAENEDNELLEEIDDIYVDYHPVYKKVKCFYAVFGEEEWLFSYLLAINGGLSDEKKFYISCRNSVKGILRNFKIEMLKINLLNVQLQKILLTGKIAKLIIKHL
jgi:hypothetical protein